jgi:hypothetical protein
MEPFFLKSREKAYYSQSLVRRSKDRIAQIIFVNIPECRRADRVSDPSLRCCRDAGGRKAVDLQGGVPLSAKLVMPGRLVRGLIHIRNNIRAGPTAANHCRVASLSGSPRLPSTSDLKRNFEQIQVDRSDLITTTGRVPPQPWPRE